MANEKSQNVQDVFLNHVRKNKTPVTVFLVNGVKLQGIITWFDNFSVLLRRDGHTQLVYKHAISTGDAGGADPAVRRDEDRGRGGGGAGGCPCRRRLTTGRDLAGTAAPVPRGRRLGG